MPVRPLLRLPNPDAVSPPKLGGGGSKPKLPTKETQVARFGLTFQRLRSVIEGAERDGEPLLLRSDPSSLAPERVIVFEVAGSVDDFAKAVSRVPGFEFLVEYETEAEPDEHFAEKDTRKGRAGKVRTDKMVTGRFYLAMPDVSALSQLVGLWERWQQGEPLDRGFAPFKHVFAQLRTLRPWGPHDRIPDDTIRYWQEELRTQPDRPVRTEVELWFHNESARRETASTAIRDAVARVNGTVLHEAIIPEIAYHGLLVEIPARNVQTLIDRSDVALALADDVMFLRPQSLMAAPGEAEEVQGYDGDDRRGPPQHSAPIAALLDGVPLQAHARLEGRILLDDPDDLQSRALAAYRLHGTAMASLILHGDLNASGTPLDRPLYVRPLMYASDTTRECTDGNRLLIDTIYRAVLRIKGAPGETATAHTVFLVNLSLGDLRRPFTGIVSPLARLLDFLSVKYDILFLVSAGNVTTHLSIPEFSSWSDFQAAEPSTRERAVLKALNAAKHERSLLSPAESLNALTIGAHHSDRLSTRPTSPIAVDPFDDELLPNPSSALGLGHRRVIKPDLFLPGGREHVRMRAAGGGGPLVLSFGPAGRLYGLAAAAPDSSGTGRTDRIRLIDGTSSATALATRACHQIFEALMDGDGGSFFADMPPEYYAVAVKALLVHRAKWNGKADLLAEVCGPADGRRFVERAENVSRFMGFGIPTVEEVLECAVNRATLLGYGALLPDNAHEYRVPLPGALARVTDPRSLTVTLAWFSPIRPGFQSYRFVKLEVAPLDIGPTLGVRRAPRQPADSSVRKGCVFHERFTGNRAIAFVEDGELRLQVWCKDDAGHVDQATRYALAVTIEAETPIAIYDEIQQRLRVAPRPPA